jgi:hypothetical protein
MFKKYFEVGTDISVAEQGLTRAKILKAGARIQFSLTGLEHHNRPRLQRLHALYVYLRLLRSSATHTVKMSDDEGGFGDDGGG